MERGRILGAVLLAAVTAGAIGYAASRQAEERAAEEAAYQAYLDALPLAEAEGETCSPNGRFQVRTAGETAAERFSPRRFLTVRGAARIPGIYLDPGGAFLSGNGLREKNLPAGVRFDPAGAFIRANRQGREIIADLFAGH